MLPQKIHLLLLLHLLRALRLVCVAYGKQNSNRSIDLLSIAIVNTELLSISLNDTVYPGTRISVRCRSNSNFGRNPSFISRVNASITTSQDTTPSNQITYFVVENKPILHQVNRKVLCTTLNAGNLTVSFKIISPIDVGDNLTLYSNDMNSVFKIGEPRCILYRSSNKYIFSTSLQNKSSTQLVYSASEAIPANSELIFECFNKSTFVKNGIIGSTLQFSLKTTQDFRVSAIKNYTIIQNQVVYKYYKSKPYFTNRPPPFGFMHLKFKTILGLTANDYIKIVANENIFQRDFGIIKTKCGVGSENNNWIKTDDKYAFDVSTSSQNELKLIVTTEQKVLESPYFQKMSTSKSFAIIDSCTLRGCRVRQPLLFSISVQTKIPIHCR